VSPMANRKYLCSPLSHEQAVLLSAPGALLRSHYSIAHEDVHVMFRDTADCIYRRISMSGRKNFTRKAPIYRIIPLNVAHSVCGPSEHAQKTSRLWAVSSLWLSLLSSYGV
jgi:hypothetical protein